MSEEQYKNFLKDVVTEILNKKDSYKQKEDDDFSKGYNFAIYDIVSLLITESQTFNIDKREIALEGINPERDFLNL